MVMILTFFAWVNALSVAAPPPDFSDGPAWLSSSESAVDFLVSSLCPSPSLQPQPPSSSAASSYPASPPRPARPPPHPDRSSQPMATSAPSPPPASSPSTPTSSSCAARTAPFFISFWNDTTSGMITSCSRCAALVAAERRDGVRPASFDGLSDAAVRLGPASVSFSFSLSFA